MPTPEEIWDASARAMKKAILKALILAGHRSSSRLFGDVLELPAPPLPPRYADPPPVGAREKGSPHR